MDPADAPVRADGRSRVDVAVFAGLIALAVAPLFAGRYLPFFDYPAHLAVPAALRHRADPATRIAALWELDLRLVPNALHYALTYLGSFLMPLQEASRLFVALFCVAALPLAAVFALVTFGRDWRLAVLVVPLCWNRALWYGFIGFCAAVPMSLVVVALIERDLRRPSARREIGLAALTALLAFTHFFVMVMTLLLAGTLALARTAGTRRGQQLRALLPLLAGPAVMAPWFLSSLHHGPQPVGGATGHLFASRPPLLAYAALLRHWFMDGYLGWFDDALALVMILTLAALTLLSRRAPADGALLPPGTRRAPLALAGVLAALYLLLPFEIHAPFQWWAMNVRALPLLFVWLLIGVAPGRLDRVGRALLVPVAATAALFFGYVAIDVARSFNGPEGMAGLDDVLSQVPPGAKVLGLYTDYRQTPHYAHYPYCYASSYAVVRGGGVAAPFIPIPQSWTNPRVVPAHPLAGDAALFRFDRHAPGFSHFLVRTCVGQGCVPDPLAGRAEVERVTERGRWRLYRWVNAAR
jgi:hypothetical protein